MQPGARRELPRNHALRYCRRLSIAEQGRKGVGGTSWLQFGQVTGRPTNQPLGPQ